MNVPYQGAKYSSNPFRLPPRGGYDVTIRRLPTTRDEKLVVLYVGATSVELKDDRVHVVQQVRLFNLGGATYDLSGGGVLAPVDTDGLVAPPGAAVPEPGAVTLAGALAVGLLARRRRRAA